MLVGVERQADRRDAGYAVAFEDAHQLALGRLEAGDEGLELLVLALILADRGERAAQIVGDRQDVARELCRGIGVRVGDLLVLSAGDVLRLGARLETGLLQRRALFGDVPRPALFGRRAFPGFR